MTELKKLISVQKAQSPIYQYPYLDYTSGGHPERLSLVQHIRNVELERKQYEITVDPYESHQIENATNYLINRMNSKIEFDSDNDIFSLMKNIAKPIENTLLKTWWNQLLGYWNPPISMVKYPNNTYKLGPRILMAGNEIAREGKRGPGHFAIMSYKNLYTMRDETGYSYVADGQVQSSDEIGILAKVGQFAGMDIYCTHLIDDETILVGRKINDDDPGIHYIYIEKEEQTIESPLTRATQVGVFWRDNIDITPGGEENYRTIKVTWDKYPFWEHIKTKIKNLWK